MKLLSYPKSAYILSKLDLEKLPIEKSNKKTKNLMNVLHKEIPVENPDKWSLNSEGIIQNPLLSLEGRVRD